MRNRDGEGEKGSERKTVGREWGRERWRDGDKWRECSGGREERGQNLVVLRILVLESKE